MTLYNYRVILDDTGEYIGLCSQFPSLSYIANDYTSALNGIIDLVNNVINDMTNNGEYIP